MWGRGGAQGSLGWQREEKDVEGEKPDETSQKYSSSPALIDTLPQPDRFILKAILCQCANTHYQLLMETQATKTENTLTAGYTDLVLSTYILIHINCVIPTLT